MKAKWKHIGGLCASLPSCLIVNTSNTVLCAGATVNNQRTVSGSRAGYC